MGTSRAQIILDNFKETFEVRTYNLRCRGRGLRDSSYVNPIVLEGLPKEVYAAHGVL